MVWQCLPLDLLCPAACLWKTLYIFPRPICLVFERVPLRARLGHLRCFSQLDCLYPWESHFWHWRGGHLYRRCKLSYPSLNVYTG